MCKREMTLGEEIIGLSTRGIDTPTVERMYRKYIEMTADKESKEDMRAYCINDELAIKEFVNALFGAPAKSDLEDVEVGDKTTIKLNGLGEFTATVHKVTDDKVMLIFDDYVAERTMNESDTNKGGFEDSDLNKWLHTEFVKALPYSIRARLADVTIPTVGEMFGWDDEWVGQAVKWLGVGAVLGIPMSYVFGFLDDKFGSVKASIILGLCEFIPVICLMLQDGTSTGLMIGWGFGVACMTGGVPTMHPCITSYVYGRKEYQSANRIIMAIQLVPSAVAAMMMTVLIQSGKATMAYGILIAIIIIGLISMIPMLKMKDANAADRMYAD